jgi:hypothetical protein
MTKYQVIERTDGMYQTYQNIGKKCMFPAFNTLRDNHIYMAVVRKDYKTGIVGNVSIRKETI